VWKSKAGLELLVKKNKTTCIHLLATSFTNSSLFQSRRKQEVEITSIIILLLNERNIYFKITFSAEIVTPIP
jgi:hypothetical protein